MNDGARVRANDPSMGKLYLTQPPSQYFRHDSNDNENGNDHNDDDDDDFQVFLKALRQNTHIHYVLLERHFVHQLIRHDERRREQQTQEQESSSCCSQPKTQGQEEEDTPLRRLKYPAILHGLAHIPHLTQLELFSVPVPIATLCTALSAARRLVRLGLGMVTLRTNPRGNSNNENNNNNDREEQDSCRGLAHHPSLECFYLSDFKVLEEHQNGNRHAKQVHGTNDNGNEPETQQDEERGTTTTTTTTTAFETLDSLWEALGTCPRLFNVEIFSNQCHSLSSSSTEEDEDDHDPIVPWTPHGLAHLALCPSLDQLTLRRLNLTSADIAPLAQRLGTTPTHEPTYADSNDHSNNHNKSSNDRTTTTTPQSSCLRVLHLQQNKLRDEGCLTIALAVATTQHSAVRELDLRDNHLSEEGVHAILPLLLRSPHSRLEKLNLASNPIGDEGARVVAESLETRQEQERQESKLPGIARASSLSSSVI